MLKILQINYRLNAAVADFLREAEPVARMLAGVAGLRWKIWLKNETEAEGGGVYLFEDAAALKKFIDGPFIEKLRAHPSVAELTVKQFDVPAELSSVTRAPV
ncbi:MAG TPA: YdhR family protein [Pyrinomonadaceae bacterium]|jgi:hypothetical protein